MRINRRGLLAIAGAATVGLVLKLDGDIVRAGGSVVQLPIVKGYVPSDVDASIPGELDWTLVGPVLAPGRGGAWDYILWSGSPGTVVKVGSTYYLYYVGSNSYDEVGETVENRAIGVATSTDGVNFTRYDRNPIVTYTNGGSTEEGASNPVVVYDGTTWHMWYGATRDYGTPGSVDVDIRYRTSTDGLTWTGDALVYRVNGGEYIPINAFKSGTTYYLYYVGALTSGQGVLRYMSGTTPSALSGTTQIAAGPFRGANGISWWDDADRLVLHLMGSTAGNVLAYVIDKDAPGTLGDQKRNYTFAGYGRFSVHRDGPTWRMYQLDLTEGSSSGSVVLRRASLP